MKKTRKLLFICAVFTAIALLFTATALAEDETVITVNNNDGSSVTFSKSILLINENGGTYYGPDVTYIYTIASETSTLPAIVDSDGHTIAERKPGPVDAVSFSQPLNSSDPLTGYISFTSSAHGFYATSEAAAADPITGSATLNFDMSEFTAPGPGVYRYVLSDTTSDAVLNEAGIVRPTDYDKTLYLDVYVKNGDNGMEIYDAVLIDDDGNKVGGFEDDEYHTFDVEITKTTVGDTSHEFPFTIAVDNNPSGDPAANMTYYVGYNTSSLSPETADSVSPKLKSGDTYYICGLSPQAKINVTETNDTSETYTVKAIAGDTTLINSKAVAPNGTVSIATETQAVTNYPTDNTLPTSVTQTATLKKIDFTNTYESISPTGLVLRYGPFVLLLAGAACFFLIGRRRKETEEESDRI